MGVVAGIAAVGSFVMNVISANDAHSAAVAARHAAGAQQEQQREYAGQLSTLMADPSAILNDPAAKAAQTATSRQMASLGYLGSGNEAAAMQQTNLNYIQTRENFLAEMAGLTQPISPLINTAASTAAYSAQAQSQLMTNLGYGLKQFGSGASGQPSGVPGWGSTPSASALPSTLSYSDYLSALDAAA